MTLRSPWGWVENEAVNLLSRPRVIDGFPVRMSLRLAVPKVVYGELLDLVVAEIEAKV
jgi:hypothetical protein